jgi:hypothetical protein
VSGAEERGKTTPYRWPEILLYPGDGAVQQFCGCALEKIEGPEGVVRFAYCPIHAAAPGLLEAAKRAANTLRLLSATEQRGGPLFQLSEAIAKAEGR